MDSSHGENSFEKRLSNRYFRVWKLRASPNSSIQRTVLLRSSVTSCHPREFRNAFYPRRTGASSLPGQFLQDRLEIPQRWLRQVIASLSRELKRLAGGSARATAVVQLHRLAFNLHLWKRFYMVIASDDAYRYQRYSTASLLNSMRRAGGRFIRRRMNSGPRVAGTRIRATS